MRHHTRGDTACRELGDAHMGLAANYVRQIPLQLGHEWIARLLTDYPRCNFQVRLWDGTILGAEQPRFTVVVKQPAALREMFFSPTELSLGESYIFDDLDIEGDIEGALDLADYLLASGDHAVPQGLHHAAALLKFPARRETRKEYEKAVPSGWLHSKSRDRQAISFHYDLPPEFFAAWLDRRMVYSCAYFAGAEESDLDAAQCRKLDYICRKLRLRRGDHLLDIGCGWGALLLHAAARYGAQVLGITLSIRQAEVARQRIRDAGLNDYCRVEVCDYRDLEPGRQFDKIVSVGMFEHVGEKQLPEYFSRAWQLLRPGGVLLNSGISDSVTNHRQGPSFIDRYVFPDGELVPLNRSLSAAEECGFEVRDVENLREHYALTLHHWVERLEAHADEARRLTDETTYRIWRLYMAASAHRFRSARLNLYHTLLAKPLEGESGLPWTRADWYSS
jgi:cyclopropane-fatty-acyl-phospholipid synthase